MIFGLAQANSLIHDRARNEVERGNSSPVSVCNARASARKRWACVAVRS